MKLFLPPPSHCPLDPLELATPLCPTGCYSGLSTQESIKAPEIILYNFII